MIPYLIRKKVKSFGFSLSLPFLLVTKNRSLYCEHFLTKNQSLFIFEQKFLRENKHIKEEIRLC